MLRGRCACRRSWRACWSSCRRRHRGIRMLHGRDAALLATALVATSMAGIEISTNARGYSIVTLLFLVLLCLGGYLRRTDSAVGSALFGGHGALTLYTIPDRALRRRRCRRVAPPGGVGGRPGGGASALCSPAGVRHRGHGSADRNAVRSDPDSHRSLHAWLPAIRSSPSRYAQCHGASSSTATGRRWSMPGPAGRPTGRPGSRGSGWPASRPPCSFRVGWAGTACRSSRNSCRAACQSF